MLKFIKFGVPFGNIIAGVCAIEFQKRGLPHTHILIWLDIEFKFETSNDIDLVVSAEMPDKNIDPLCHEIWHHLVLHLFYSQMVTQPIQDSKSHLLLMSHQHVPLRKALIFQTFLKKPLL
uniref:Helitron helicase-like domain-containing protein n=1 Tax=Salix viminalis TaxID=40686 RepID=A0A6N2LRW6_SALVM